MRTSPVIFLFFLQAVAGGGIFSRIPDIQQGLGLSEASLGLALSVAAMGGLSSMLVSGQIMARFGTRPILYAGLPLVAVFSAGVGFAPNLPTLYLALLLNGLAFALTNVAMNVEADRTEAASGSKIMNRCHGVWSIGMVVASLIGVAARGLDISPQVHLAAVVLPVLVLTILAMAPLAPAPRAADDSDSPSGVAWPDRRTLILTLFAISAGIAQSGTQNWSVIFMRDTFSAPDWLDTLTLPSFLIAMAAGRLVADGWMNRFGTRPVAVWMTVLAAFGNLLAVTSPNLAIALFGFGLLGFGTSVHYPLMVTAAARAVRRPAADSVSAVMLVYGAAMMAAPAVLGVIAESFGLRAGFAIALPFFAATVILLLQNVLTPRRPAPI